MPKKENLLKTNTFKQKEESATPPPKSKTSRKKKAPGNSILKDERIRKVAGVSLIFMALYIFVAFGSFFYNWFNQLTDDMLPELAISRILTDTSLEINNITGNLGAYLSENLVKIGFGLGSIFLPFLIFAWGFRLTTGLKIIRPWPLWKYAIIFLLWMPLLFGFFMPHDPWNVLGGYVGHFMAQYLSSIIGSFGVIALLLFTFLVYLIVSFNFSLLWKSDKKDKSKINKSKESSEGDKYNTVEFAVDEEDETDFVTPKEGKNKRLVTEDKSIAKDEDDGFEAIEQMPPAKPTESEKDVELSVEPAAVEKTKTKGTIERQTIDTQFDPTLDLPDYRFPPLDLLNMYGDGTISVDRDELEANKRRIVETLGNYSIGIEKIKATIGPTVTLYEIIPSAGVRISRIKGLEDDIALSLSAIGIRIIAPIPGKGTVGIEVPNQKPEIVSMRSIIGSDRFTNNGFELPFGIGKTIANESFVADLTKMPHILMAGATGAGAIPLA